MLNLGPINHLTMPAAAYAIGAEPRTVRGWIESGAVPLLVPRKASGKWLRVPPTDVLRLAVVGHLLRYGFTLAEAGAVVSAHVDPLLSAVVLAAGDVTWHLLRNRLLGLVLQISREPEGRIAVSAHSLRVSRPVWHRGATLAVNVGAILQDVQARACDRDSRNA